MANKELLIKVLEHIKANPAEWDQVRFSACFAGWAVRLSKPVQLKENDYGSYLELDGKPLTYWDIDREAAALLGLTREQQIKLFCGANSLADLELYVSALVAGEPLPAHVCA